MKTLTCRTLMYLLAAVCLHAQPPQEAQVRSLMADFLKAFNNLDWPAFRKCWVDDPVVFYPSPVQNPTGKRTDTSSGFEEAWRGQFDRTREAAAKRGVTSPPFQDIVPRDLRIDFPAPTVAVVTFHLGPGANGIGRRMFVLAKTADGWKITHLHASNLSPPPN